MPRITHARTQQRTNYSSGVLIRRLRDTSSRDIGKRRRPLFDEKFCIISNGNYKHGTNVKGTERDRAYHRCCDDAIAATTDNYMAATKHCTSLTSHLRHHPFSTGTVVCRPTGNVIITIDSSTIGATTMYRMNLSRYVGLYIGHVTIFS